MDLPTQHVGKLSVKVGDADLFSIDTSAKGGFAIVEPEMRHHLRKYACECGRILEQTPTGFDIPLYELNGTPITMCVDILGEFMRNDFINVVEKHLPIVGRANVWVRKSKYGRLEKEEARFPEHHSLKKDWIFAWSDTLRDPILYSKVENAHPPCPACDRCRRTPVNKYMWVLRQDWRDRTASWTQQGYLLVMRPLALTLKQTFPRIRCEPVHILDEHPIGFETPKSRKFIPGR